MSPLTLTTCCLVIAVALFSSGADAVSRTPWEVHLGYTRVSAHPNVEFPTLNGNPYGTHGQISMYDLVDGPNCPSDPVSNHPCAPIPPQGDAGWGLCSAAGLGMNDDTIGMVLTSKLCSTPRTCFGSLDFTYFQTIVNVDSDDSVSEFKIRFEGMDDGSRITIFNTQYPTGLVVPGSYVFLGGSGTSDLKQYLVRGNNRVVITQVDDCCSGNFLRVAAVTINSVDIPPTDPVDPTDGCTCFAAGATSATVSGATSACICFNGNSNECR